MLHTKPSTKKETVHGGFVENYKFSRVEKLHAHLETFMLSSFSEHEKSSKPRLFFIAKGEGSAKVDRKYHDLREGVVLEVPAGIKPEFSGMFQALIVENADSKIETLRYQGFSSYSKSTTEGLLYVLEGAGVAKAGDRSYSLREPEPNYLKLGTLLELPASEEVSLSGNLKALVFTLKK